MKFVLGIVIYIYVFKELKENKMYKVVINVENTCVY